MAKRIEHEVAYYYDFHPTKEDLMGETSFHRRLTEYLAQVLAWLFHQHICAIYENLNFYQTANLKEYPLAPDIAVIKGVNFQYVRSWRVGKSGPAPQVVFEIASEETSLAVAQTWSNDLREKPTKYARMGVSEYFAYDPNEPLLDRASGRRLFGWQLDSSAGLMREMRLRADGSLWSSQLQSILMPENDFLRLYDSQGHLRLTQAEAEAGQAQIEAMRAEREAARANREAMRAEREATRAQAMAERLRSLGIDPDQL